MSRQFIQRTDISYIPTFIYLKYLKKKKTLLNIYRPFILSKAVLKKKMLNTQQKKQLMYLKHNIVFISHKNSINSQLKFQQEINSNNNY